jgi:hypothetical protein
MGDPGEENIYDKQRKRPPPPPKFKAETRCVLHTYWTFRIPLYLHPEKILYTIKSWTDHRYAT